MKRTILAASLLAAALAAALLLPVTSCVLQNQKESGNDSRQLTVIHVWGSSPLEQGFQDVTDNFNETFAEHGYQMEYRRYASSDATENLRLETSLLSGVNDIDIYISYTTQTLHKRVEAGLSLDLSGLCERDVFDMEKNFTGDIKKLYYDGKPYSVPSTIGKMGIILNKDIFDAHDIPVPTDWTFDEFRDIANKLTFEEGGEKVYGVFWNTQANISESLLHFVLPTLGGDALYRTLPDGSLRSNLDDPVILSALNLLDNTMNVDSSAPTHEESVIQKLSMDYLFFNGRCAMTVGAWLYESAISQEPYPHDFVTAFAPWPVVDKNERNYVQGSFGGHLSINPRSSSIDAAWEFVKWYSTEGIKALIPHGYIPSYTGITARESKKLLLSRANGMVDENSIVALFLNPDNKMSIPVVSTEIEQVTRIFDNAVEDVLTTGADSAQVLTQAREAADRLLE